VKNGDLATLLLKGTAVGTVLYQGTRNSWSYGEFSPFDAFAAFAEVFGRWSLLMHADGAEERLSPEAGVELREAEYAIDALKAELRTNETDPPRRLAQVNIDGRLIEWKEF